MNTQLPWIEKYRPKSLDNIIGNQCANQQFKNIVSSGNIPHLLLSGVPGTGKTTSVICLAKIILQEKFYDAFIELNASDERGIDVIRNKITTFCKKKVTLPEKAYKIIFLDEVDYMTPIAQQALRRIIELYTSSTRFIMACNSSSNIIEAIQSRCVLIRFSKIDTESIFDRLKTICALENLEYSDEGLMQLIKISDGDVRRAINNLQSIAITFGNVTPENITDIANLPSTLITENLIKKCLEKKFENAQQIITNLVSDGYDAQDIIHSLFYTIKDYKMDPKLKLCSMKYIGKAQINLAKGGDPMIQLLALIAKIILENDKL